MGLTFEDVLDPSLVAGAYARVAEIIHMLREWDEMIGAVIRQVEADEQRRRIKRMHEMYHRRHR